MKLEDQVASLELSKRLKELGVRQESAFYWRQEVVNLEPEWVLRTWHTGDEREEISAFTVAELGEMLPVKVVEAKDDIPMYKKYWENGMRDLHSVGYESPMHKICLQEFDRTEANARSKMLIYLIEKGIVKP